MATSFLTNSSTYGGIPPQKPKFNSIFSCIGASNHTEKEREKNDYYATPPAAVENLLKVEKFTQNVLEPACGEGHISKVLLENGYDVVSSDLIDRHYGEVKDFFDVEKWDGDIITNPPYKIALKFLSHALDIVPVGNKVAMLLKLTFLEGNSRGEFFKTNPPKKVYVYSYRINPTKNGEFDDSVSSAVAYAWYVWEKGYQGSPVIDWIRKEVA